MKLSDESATCEITGCCYLPGDHLILCDESNKKIKLTDLSSVVDSLPGDAWDVAAVDRSNVIVTMGKRLQFIQVLPSLKLGHSIDVGERCRGVAVAAGKIFVSCSVDIRVYDLEGRDLGKRIGINPDGSSMFRRPWYIAVSRSGDKIFISDCDNETVSCVTYDGEIVYQYNDDELRNPAGLLVDDNDNVIVCG